MPTTFFAIWKSGAVAVPICETLTEESQAFILEDFSSQGRLASDRFKPERRGCPSRVNNVERSSRTASSCP